MSERKCSVCGLLEERRKDAQGRDTVNLDPHTNLCVTCLIGLAKEQSKPMPAGWFDPKQAQMPRNDE